jgi:hypothetical protein
VADAHRGDVKREDNIREFEAEDGDDEGDRAGRGEQRAVGDVAPAPRAQQRLAVNRALEAA